MKKLLFTGMAFLLAAKIYSQCTLAASGTRDTIVCGQSVTLSAFGKGQGVALLSENFNNGSFGPGWGASPQAMWNNPCSPNGVDGTKHIWLGNSSPVPRILTTASFNLSSCVNAGVTVCFDLLFATQANNSPCEGPDEPQEGVYLQYSTNNGATWTTIHYFNPNGGYDPQLVNWNNWCFPVPAVALTANTRFRWFQDADSGADYDHWGVDNVVIYCNDPTYNIVWQHDNYNSGATGGINPTPVAPRTTTSYVVVMTNGTVTCRDTVEVAVVNPIIQPNAGNDTSICAGSCVQLNANAKVIARPAKVPTYRNIQPDTADLTSFLGVITTGADVNINITSLNMTSILPNSILRVCVDQIKLMGFPFVPNAADIELLLICPDSSVITLVPDSQTTGAGGFFNYNTVYNNTCFVPSGPQISSGSPPYTGSYATSQSFNNLVGCDANGVWTLAVITKSVIATGKVITTGWSITFDDPEISYTGNFNWNPTTNMTGSNTLTPTVCPTTSPVTYTLTVSDTANCVTASDAVTISTHVCCTLTASAVLTQASCGLANGAIDLSVSPNGTYTYAWSDGPAATQDRTGLAAGTYRVTITDVPNNCNKDTFFTITNASSLSLAFPAMVNPTCAGNDGSLTVTLSGGTAPYMVTIDTGGTPATIPIPVAGTQVLPGLHAGTVNISITDAQGCQTSNDTTLVAATNCCTFTISLAVTQPTCGNSNGSATVGIQNGSGNYTFVWGSGGSTTGTANGLSAGAISVTVTDVGQACSKDTSAVLNSNSTLAITFSNKVNPTCTGSDGQITVGLSGGTAPYSVTIDTGGVPQTVMIPIAGSQPLGNLPAGFINIVVTDAQGCQTSNTDSLVPPANCCTFTVSAVIAQPACGQADGGIALTATNGSGSYGYNWSGGLGVNSSISSVGAGNYDVTITDNGFANCFIDTTFSLTNPNAPVINSVDVANEICPGSGDGFAIINASGGTGALTYNWSNTQTSDTAINLTAGSYGFTVTDASGCQATGVAVVQSGYCCTLQTSSTVVPPACGQNTGTITVNIATAGVPPYQYSIDGISYQVSNIFNNVPSGAYNVFTLDSACGDTVTATIPQGGANLNITVTSTNVTCFGGNDGAALAVSNNGDAPFTYLWNTSAVTDAIGGLAPGAYTVTVTDMAGCSGTGNTSIAQPAQLILNIGDNVIVCEGTVVTLNAGTGFNNYVWSSGEITESIAPQVTGNYAVTVQDANGCTASDGVSVTIVPTPDVDLGDDITAYEDTRVAIFPEISGNTTGGAYNWQPETFLSCHVCSTTVATAERDITYTLIYTDQNGCTSSDDIVINVIPIVEIFWPNAFSPNGDGNNDIYLPYGSGVKLIAWKIFNRWGEKIFDSNNFFHGWDGTYKGQMQNPAVFIYEANVTMMNDNTKKFKGSFTLIR